MQKTEKKVREEKKRKQEFQPQVIKKMILVKTVKINNFRGDFVFGLFAFLFVKSKILKKWLWIIADIGFPELDSKNKQKLYEEEAF